MVSRTATAVNKLAIVPTGGHLMEHVEVWQSRPIFVTSTFQDMQAERDHLMLYVFPAIEEWLVSRYRHLEWVDLRVGVARASSADEAERELLVLKVCLDEVRRSRPFIIGLLGDRYGWVPPPERMAVAAAEAGFDTSVEGRSVTDLEIDYGVFADLMESRRSLFFLRASLPYEQMSPEVAAVYCDAMATDPEASARAARLAELKARLRREVPERCIEYEVTWDHDAKRVTGLESWGQMVEGQLRAALEAEFAEDPATTELTRSQVKNRALEDFIQDRARGFVGRTGTMNRLMSIAESPPGADDAWGICVTGGPGSGKTSVFAEMFKRLHSRQIFTLAHSPSVITRGTWVGFMMQRFIGDFLEHPDAPHLFRYTAEGDPIEKELVGAVFAPNAQEEHIYTLFGLLLSRMAERQRVVILIDALGQMEPISTARFLGWMKEHCPANTRLLMTTIPGRVSAILTGHPGIELHPLPPLEHREAGSIVEGIFARYHRQLEPAVLNALVSKSGPETVPWSMPLWLVIAAEELNLIDADDFSRAARYYTGRDDERLTALMCDLIGEMPAGIQQMYRAKIARAESIFRPELVSAFLSTICVGRFGWRKIDFRALLPRLSGEAWDDLRFANLRRLFRGHLRRQVPLGRWHFLHGQMRLATRNWLAELGIEVPTIHSVIADHLLTLSTDDPVRVEEVMVHLLGAEDWSRAARYLGDSGLDEAGAIGAGRVMAGLIRSAPEHEPAQAANTLVRLLEVEGMETNVQSRVAGHLLNVHVKTQGRCSVASEEALLVPLEAYLDRLVSQESGNHQYLEQHSASLMWLGNLYRDQGDLEGSLECFRRAEGIQKRMADSVSINGRPHEPPPSLNVGDALFSKGDLDGALAIYSHPEYAHSSAGHCRIGNILRMRHDLDGALASYSTGIEIP